jgi:putative flippase GtrA
MSLPAPIASLSERVRGAWRGGAVSLKAVSFALVGLINTAVDAAIFFLLLAYVTPSLAIANVAAWFIANIGSYVMNAFTTFSAETGGRLSLRHYAGFVGSGLVAVTASTITVELAAKFLPVLAPKLGEIRLGTVTAAVAIAKAIAILVSFAVNFSITHLVVFRSKGERIRAARNTDA